MEIMKGEIEALCCDYFVNSFNNSSIEIKKHLFQFILLNHLKLLLFIIKTIRKNKEKLHVINITKIKDSNQELIGNVLSGSIPELIEHNGYIHL